MCKDHAKAKHNLSVERIADEMGLTAVRLYQHLENGDMPLSRVRSYQRACRCNYVTLYMAHGDECMLIKIPNGKKLSDDQMLNINATFHTALSMLTQFYQTAENPEAALAALTSHMATTAWHRANIEKHLQPEFDFEDQ